ARPRLRLRHRGPLARDLLRGRSDRFLAGAWHSLPAPVPGMIRSGSVDDDSEDEDSEDSEEEDDLVLLERWRSGDERAGEALCARYFEEIYRFFVHKLPEHADDLMQQTFLACVKSRDRFQGKSSFRTYLFAIARNELLMLIRVLTRPREQVDLDDVS